jgi:hypothetical protein
MKKQSILKSLSYSVMLTGLIAIIPSCTKEKKSPVNNSQAATTSIDDGSLSNDLPPTPIPAYAPTIYGIQTGGTGGHNLYTIDRNNGAILTQQPITFTGGGGIAHGALFGIAKIKCSQTGYLSAVSVCGTSGQTQFYSFNFSTRLATLLGSTYGGNLIKDIECHPTTNVVYGINGNMLVRMTSFGTMCTGTGSPATFDILGDLSSVGVGPYSISFNHLGDCAIMSAKDHKRAYVVIPTTPIPPSTPIIPPIAISGTVIQGLTPDLYSVFETASCISGTTQFIGINGKVNPSLGNSYDFYKWATNSSGTLIYQLLDGDIYTGMADYTSDNGTAPCPK